VTDFGLEVGVSYIEFGYDWRRDNRVAARRLAATCRRALAAWRQQSPDARIILLAHSMGGLVARYFLEVLEGWRSGDVRALITFGTPFRGSATALDTLANGVHRGSVDLTQMSRSFTSVYQLLPLYPMYDPGDGRYVRVGETTGIPNVDADRARAALAFHHEIRDAVARNRADPWWEQLGYRLYPVVGRMQPTLQTGAGRADGVTMSTTFGGQDVRGDGTVPRVSAIPLEFDDTGARADLYAASKHGSLQNADSVLTHLVGRITDFFTDFGDWRSPKPVGPDLALEVPDLVRSDEEIVVRAQGGGPVTATLLAHGGDRPSQTRTAQAEPSSWATLTFDPTPAGRYEVQLSDGGGGEPVRDSIAVADADAVDRLEGG
jgi:pimeloyl-ACP methyl ester carboxylesterase